MAIHQSLFSPAADAGLGNSIHHLHIVVRLLQLPFGLAELPPVLTGGSNDSFYIGFSRIVYLAKAVLDYSSHVHILFARPMFAAYTPRS